MLEVKSNKIVSALLKSGVAISALVMAGGAFAQTPVQVPQSTDTDTATSDTAAAQTAAATGEKEENVVVTGTIVRGIAPPGTNVVSMDAEHIQSTGVTSTAQLLAELPQMLTFNTVSEPNQFLPVNRPNLRGLPGFNTTGGSATLMLMDGHRIVGLGISSTTPDSDMIPPGAIQRMDVVPDGGSSIYGSDAIAGVINMLTRSRFDGVEVNARAGFTDDYYQVDGNFTVGTQWGSGGVFASYGFAQHDAIYGRDRDWIVQLPDATTGLTSLTCSPGNVTVTVGGVANRFGLPYADNGGTLGAVNQCDNTDSSSLTSFQRRHSALIGFQQDITENVRFDAKGYYFNRHQASDGAPFAGLGGPFQVTQTISSTSDSPFFDDFNPAGFPTQPHSVAFRFGPDDASGSVIDSMAWGITPTLTVDVGSGWQVRALGSYGESRVTQHSGTLPPNGLVNALHAGLINPYNPLASDPATVAILSNFENFSEGKQRLLNGRIIADGDLIDLPGGAVKLAFGAEYLKTWFQQQGSGQTISGNDGTGAPAVTVADPTNGGVVTLVPATTDLPIKKASQDVTSVFGELVVPIFGPDNASPGFERLTLSASVRYDHYNTFGDTVNPKFGITYKPVPELTFRGAWGTSFNAPSPANSEAVQAKNANFNLASNPNTFLPPSPAPGPDQYVLTIGGGNNEVGPQEAEAWTAGVDFDVPFLSGLTLSATYWNIYLKNLLQAPPVNDPLYYSLFTNLYIINPTQAQIDAALNNASTITVQNGAAQPVAPAVFLIRDNRVNNLGNYKTDGVDMQLSYRTDTSFGSMDLRSNATVVLHEKRSVGANPYVDASVERSDFRVSTTLGADIGEHLRTQLAWRFQKGYKRAANVQQPYTAINDWHIFDLFFRYDVKGEGMFENLAFTFNINNVFDKKPQLNANNLTGASPTTLGRLFLFGVSERF
jgi:iron complex outermembrane receptor protein